MKYLFLFDVDGTLVRGFQAHHKAFINAFKQIFKVETKVEMYKYHGSTDLFIIYDVLTKNNIPTNLIDKKINLIQEEMIKIYNREVSKDQIQALPGALDVLDLIKNNKEGLGLVTGNLGEIAKLKLQQVNIANYFPIGGFGQTSKIRSELVNKGINEAKKYYKIDFSNENIFIVGDTPRDVEAAHKANVKAMAIATGDYSMEELIKKDPEYVLNDLIELNQTLKNNFF